MNGSASAKGASAPVCGLTWPILITFEVAGLAVVPRKIAGPALAVAPSSLITSRRRHNRFEWLAGLIVWGTPGGRVEVNVQDRLPMVRNGEAEVHSRRRLFVKRTTVR